MKVYKDKDKDNIMFDTVKKKELELLEKKILDINNKYSCEIYKQKLIIQKICAHPKTQLNVSQTMWDYPHYEIVCAICGKVINKQPTDEEIKQQKIKEREEKIEELKREIEIFK